MIPPRCEAIRFLLCDDIREERDGRQSIIGVLGPSLAVDRFPVTQRGLSAFVQLVNPADGYASVDFELVAPDGAILRGSGPTPEATSIAEQPVFSTYRMHFVPWLLTSPGRYLVRVWFDRVREVGIETGIEVRLRLQEN